MNKITFKSYKKDGTKKEKTIEEIIIIDAESQKLIGTAYGADVHHCLCLARKFCPYFDEVVRYYRIGKLKENERARGFEVAIEFYERE